MDNERHEGIGELVHQHPALVIGGVVLVGTVILVGRKSGAGENVGNLGAASSSTAVSADTLNHALDTQRRTYEDLLNMTRQQLEDQWAQNEENQQQYYSPQPDPAPTPGPLPGGEGDPGPAHSCTEGHQWSEELGYCIPIHHILGGGGFDPHAQEAPGDRIAAYNHRVKSGVYGF